MHTLTRTLEYTKSFDGEQLSLGIFGEVKNPKHTYILLSGIGGGTTSWEFFISELLTKTPHAKCITVNLRGHAHSSHKFPTAEQSVFSVYAKDVCEVIKNENCLNTTFTLIGHSMGGLIIQEMLGKYPEYTSQNIVLICSPLAKTYFSDDLLRVWYKLLAVWSLIFHSEKEEMSLTCHLQYKNSHDFSPWRIAHDIRTLGLLPFFFLWMSSLSWQLDVKSTLRKKSLLLIFGIFDHVVTPQLQKEIIEQLPKASVFFVDTGHNAVVNRPEELAAAVVKFTAEN